MIRRLRSPLDRSGSGFPRKRRGLATACLLLAGLPLSAGEATQPPDLAARVGLVRVTRHANAADNAAGVVRRMGASFDVRIEGADVDNIVAYRQPVVSLKNGTLWQRANNDKDDDAWQPIGREAVRDNANPPRRPRNLDAPVIRLNLAETLTGDLPRLLRLHELGGHVPIRVARHDVFDLPLKTLRDAKARTALLADPAIAKSGAKATLAYANPNAVALRWQVNKDNAWRVPELLDASGKPLPFKNATANLHGPRDRTLVWQTEKRIPDDAFIRVYPWRAFEEIDLDIPRVTWTLSADDDRQRYGRVWEPSEPVGVAENNPRIVNRPPPPSDNPAPLDGLTAAVDEIRVVHGLEPGQPDIRAARPLEGEVYVRVTGPNTLNLLSVGGWSVDAADPEGNNIPIELREAQGNRWQVAEWFQLRKQDGDRREAALMLRGRLDRAAWKTEAFAELGGRFKARVGRWRSVVIPLAEFRAVGDAPAADRTLRLAGVDAFMEREEDKSLRFRCRYATPGVWRAPELLTSDGKPAKARSSNAGWLANNDRRIQFTLDDLVAPGMALRVHYPDDMDIVDVAIPRTAWRRP